MRFVATMGDEGEKGYKGAVWFIGLWGRQQRGKEVKGQ